MTTDDSGIVRLSPCRLTLTLDENATAVLRTGLTNEALDHEQRHWNIAMLAARVMAKDLGTITGTSEADLNAKMNAVQQLHQTRYVGLQLAYDTDTGHQRISLHNRNGIVSLEPLWHRHQGQ